MASVRPWKRVKPRDTIITEETQTCLENSSSVSGGPLHHWGLGFKGIRGGGLVSKDSGGTQIKSQ